MPGDLSPLHLAVTAHVAAADLVELPCEERYGFLWVDLSGGGQGPAAGEPQPQDESELSENLGWLRMQELEVFARDERVWRCNWKIIAEGALESYHFPVSHKDTIGPFFSDNLFVYDRFGDIIRTTLPLKRIERIADRPKEKWRIREICYIAYNLIPFTSFLVQADHVVWVHSLPLAVDKTKITVSTLVPRGDNDDSRRTHWKTNHDLTCATLNEDFSMGESVQRGLASPMNRSFRLGRNETAIEVFHDIVDGHCGDVE